MLSEHVPSASCDRVARTCSRCGQASELALLLLQHFSSATLAVIGTVMVLLYLSDPRNRSNILQIARFIRAALLDDKRVYTRLRSASRLIDFRWELLEV